MSRLIAWLSPHQLRLPPAAASYSGKNNGVLTLNVHTMSLSEFLRKFRRHRPETTLAGWPLNSPVTGFALFLFGTFVLLTFMGGIPERPIVKRVHSEKKIVSNVDAAFQQNEATSVSSLQYGERLPDFVVHDFKGNIVRSDWLKDSVSVFCVFTPTDFSALEASIRYANTLSLLYKTEAVRVLLVCRVPGEVDETTWAEIVNTIELKSKVTTLIDSHAQFSRVLKIPFALCPSIVITDRENIVRLALSSAPDDLVEEIIDRYLPEVSPL